MPAGPGAQLARGGTPLRSVRVGLQPGFQRASELLGVGETLRGLTGHRTADDGAERERRQRSALADRHRRTGEEIATDLQAGARHAPLVVGGVPGEREVEQSAERVDVTPRTRRIPRRDLGRGERVGPERPLRPPVRGIGGREVRQGDGDVGGDGAVRAGTGSGEGPPRDLGRRIRARRDVARPEVAVGPPTTVRERQRLGGSTEHANDLRQRPCPVARVRPPRDLVEGQPATTRGAPHDVGARGVVEPHVVHGGHGGMGEPAGHEQLAHAAREEAAAPEVEILGQPGPDGFAALARVLDQGVLEGPLLLEHLPGSPGEGRPLEEGPQPLVEVPRVTVHAWSPPRSRPEGTIPPFPPLGPASP